MREIPILSTSFQEFFIRPTGFISIVILCLLTVSCTSRVEEGQPAQSKTEFNSEASESGGGDSCATPSGLLLEDGQSMTVFSRGNMACGTSCDSVQGTVSCSKGQLTGNTDFEFASCVTETCRCKFGDFYLNEGQSVDFYNRSTGSCDVDADMCANNKATVRCLPGGVIDGPDPVVYAHRSCNRPTCYCDLGNGISIREGSSRHVYVSNTVACGVRCHDNDNRGLVQCSNTGVATGDLDRANFMSCEEPDCSCPLPSGMTVQYGAQLTVYSGERAACGQSCSDFSGTVACNAANTPTATPAGAVNYQYSSCIQESCEGEGGGNGGGTGNDYGPGMGWFDDGSGGGGGGPGRPGNRIFISKNGCDTPWDAAADEERNPAGTNKGRIAEGAYIVAYSRTQVNCDDKCSNHSIIRYCRNGVLSGDPSYNRRGCNSTCE